MESINLELVWPESIEAKDLRRFILRSIDKKGELIRWSIYEISNKKNNLNKKIIKINALVLN